MTQIYFKTQHICFFLIILSFTMISNGAWCSSCDIRNWHKCLNSYEKCMGICNDIYRPIFQDKDIDRDLFDSQLEKDKECLQRCKKSSQTCEELGKEECSQGETR